MSAEQREDEWSAVNRTARSVAAMRLLDGLVYGERALIRDRCIPLLMDPGMLDHTALAGVQIPAEVGADPERIAAWLARADADPSATRLRVHIDRLALRTAKIDALLEDFLGRVTQLVIVGAGLDTRAFNLAAARGAVIFEVDFPHVLAYKRERLRTVPLACRARVEIPCDAASTAFAEILLASGFDNTLPTLWLIEGVLVYLTAGQIVELNRNLRMLSAPGSRLIATFMGRNTPETFSRGMVSRFDDAPQMLARYGWRAQQLHYAEIAREYGRSYPADYDVYLAWTEPLG